VEEVEDAVPGRLHRDAEEEEEEHEVDDEAVVGGMEAGRLDREELSVDDSAAGGMEEDEFDFERIWYSSVKESLAILTSTKYGSLSGQM
jgi:hypothetical protein